MWFYQLVVESIKLSMIIANKNIKVMFVVVVVAIVISDYKQAKQSQPKKKGLNFLKDDTTTINVTE